MAEDINRNNACMLIDGETQICIDPSEPVLRALGKKYSILLISVIGNENTRGNFNDIRKSIPESSNSIISRRIRDLISTGIIKKASENGIVTYALTDFGYELRKRLIPILRFIEMKTR